MEATRQVTQRIAAGRELHTSGDRSVPSEVGKEAHGTEQPGESWLFAPREVDHQQGFSNRFCPPAPPVRSCVRRLSMSLFWCSVEDFVLLTSQEGHPGSLLAPVEVLAAGSCRDAWVPCLPCCPRWPLSFPFPPPPLSDLVLPSGSSSAWGPDLAAPAGSSKG